MNRLQYYKDYQNRKRIERRNYCIEKLGGKCIECGSTEDLQFDHITPINAVGGLRPVGTTIAALLTCTLDRLNKELEKCQLLCKPCHVYKTNHIDREHASLRHGTISAIRYCKPICDKCREVRKDVQRQYMRNYRASHMRFGDKYV